MKYLLNKDTFLAINRGKYPKNILELEKYLEGFKFAVCNDKPVRIVKSLFPVEATNRVIEGTLVSDNDGLSFENLKERASLKDNEYIIGYETLKAIDPETIMPIIAVLLYVVEIDEELDLLTTTKDVELAFYFSLGVSKEPITEEFCLIISEIFRKLEGQTFTFELDSEIHARASRTMIDRSGLRKFRPITDLVSYVNDISSQVVDEILNANFEKIYAIHTYNAVNRETSKMITAFKIRANTKKEEK